MLRIYLLGNPQIFDGDEPLPLPTPGKVLELWTYLLLNRQRPVLRDHLAYTLWPDVPEAEARANLRRHLHLLRKQLPALPADIPWIVATRKTLQWNPEAICWLDVALLEELDEENVDDTQWTAAIEAYRGDLLEGLYDNWVLVERAHLQLKYIHILEQRIAQQKSTGDWPGAIRTTQRLLAHDSLREEPYRHLMELYYRAGDRAAALREFEKCETMLHTELGVAPMPETLALRDSILSGADLSSPPASALVPSPGLELAPLGSQAVLSTPLPDTPVPQRRTMRQHPWVWLLGAGMVLIVLVALGLLLAGMLPRDSADEPVTTSVFGPAVAQDTWINNLSPDLPYDPVSSTDLYSIYPQVHLQYFNYPYDRVLIRFNLRQFTPDATIEQAVFRLHFEAFTNEDLPEPLPATVSAFRILRPWQQDTATFNAPWAQPGMAPAVDYADQPLGSQAIHSTEWVSIDVTELVREWLADPDRNWGLVVMITEASQGAHYWVDTTDYPISTRQPRLDITYSP